MEEVLGTLSCFAVPSLVPLSPFFGNAVHTFAQDARLKRGSFVLANNLADLLNVSSKRVLHHGGDPSAVVGTHERMLLLFVLGQAFLVARAAIY